MNKIFKKNALPAAILLALLGGSGAATAVVTGDITQIDLPSDKQSGLKHATKVLEGVEGVAFTNFTRNDVVRHELVQRIVKAYEDAEREG